MRAIQIDHPGDVRSLALKETAEPQLREGGLLVDVIAAGVDARDLDPRTGAGLSGMPFIPGSQGVGIVRVVGPGAKGFAPGDRVAWAGGEAAYAEVSVAPAASAVVLPYYLPDAAGLMLADGLDAHYLAHDTVDIAPGEYALVRAADTGVGALLTRILKNRSARIIVTVSSAHNIQAATLAGADQVIVAPSINLSAQVRALTNGTAVHVVFDLARGNSFDESLALLREGGVIVSRSGVDGDQAPRASARSIRCLHPAMSNHTVGRIGFEARTDDLFRWLNDGRLDIIPGVGFPLEQAAAAHRALESLALTSKPFLSIESNEKQRP